MSSSGEWPPFYFIVGFISGLLWFYKGFVALKRRRLIENTPTSKVRSIAMGLVEVYGKVALYNEKFLSAPFSGKKCVYYEYTIQENNSSGRGDRWATVSEGGDATPFYLQDDTGSVLVNANGAKIGISKELEWNSGMGYDPPKNIMEFLKSKGIKHEGLFGINKSLRFKERIIEPGNMLYIMGTAKDNPYIEEGSSETNEADIMIGKGEHNMYYIADQPEKKVLEPMSSCNQDIYGGAALSIVCLGLIIAYLNEL